MTQHLDAVMSEYFDLSVRSGEIAEALKGDLPLDERMELLAERAANIKRRGELNVRTGSSAPDCTAVEQLAG